MRAQNIECSFGCVTPCTVLWNQTNIFPFNFCEQKFLQHGPITIGLSLPIFEEKWSNYASGPKSAPNSDPFLMRRLFNVCVLVFCVLNIKVQGHLKCWLWRMASLQWAEPKKACQVRSNVKVLLSVFFCWNAMVHYELLPQGRTANKKYYLKVMRRLREAIS